MKSLCDRVGIVLRCRTCGEDKAAENFWKQRSKTNGHQSECKRCMRARNNRWHMDNMTPEEMSRRRSNTNRSHAKNYIRILLASIKHRAKKRGIQFSLTEADISIPSHCPVLGIPIMTRMGEGRRRGGMMDDSPSIDRIENNKGYLPGNIVVVSYRANRIKSDASADELSAVASFYRRLHEQRLRQAGPDRDQASDAEDRQHEDDLPEVQSHAKEPERPMFVGLS